MNNTFDGHCPQKRLFVGGNLVSNSNQVLFSSELAAQGVGLILKVLLNPTLGGDASHPCLISTWPKEGCTIVCVITLEKYYTKCNTLHTFIWGYYYFIYFKDNWWAIGILFISNCSPLTHKAHISNTNYRVEEEIIRVFIGRVLSKRLRGIFFPWS